MDDAIELADMIRQLRHELSRAMWEGEHTGLRFKAERVELELTVGVERSVEPGVKVRFWVFDANAALKRSTAVKQKLTLTRPGSSACVSPTAWNCSRTAPSNATWSDATWRIRPSGS